jgi:hypothetical protein
MQIGDTIDSEHDVVGSRTNITKADARILLPEREHDIGCAAFINEKLRIVERPPTERSIVRDANPGRVERFRPPLIESTLQISRPLDGVVERAVGRSRSVVMLDQESHTRNDTLRFEAEQPLVTICR